MMISAATSADHVIAVAVDGDSNMLKIMAGGSRLLIEKRHNRAASPTTPIEILLTERQASTLRGRGPDLAVLAAWRETAAIVAVRCITGRGGSGKTRLAIEACAAAEQAGWSAGFVTSEELARFHQTQNLASWALPKPVLLVIDYAATSLPILKSWFAAVARNPPTRGAKLRILLLERHADADAGWWADLLRRESRAAGPADLIGNQALHPLPLLDSVEDRRALLAEAMRLAAPLLDPPRPVLAPPPPGADPAFDAQLAAGRIDNEPLYLLMAGIHAAQHGVSAELALGRGDLAEAMASIETARIASRATAWGHADGGALLLHLAACITLQNGSDLADLPGLVTAEAAAMSLPLPAPAEQVAQQLCDVLPQLGDRVEPLRPELIGEAFSLRHVTGGKIRNDAVRAGIINRAWQRAPAAVVDSLVRTAQDFAAGSANHRAVQWLSGIVAQSADLDDLIRLSDGLPDQTLALRELALAVLQRITAIVRNVEGMESVLATTLNNLANRLSDLGQREAALAAAQEAVTLYRMLAAARPDAFTPELARSLNTLANRLSDLGQREAALAAAQEAVTLRRTLAAARPDAFTPDLAMSLNNLANILSDLGQREAALAAAQEAVTLRRTLAAARPDAFTPDLAMSLNNLANRLSDLGQREAALAAAQEAMTLYRMLAAARPDVFTPELATSLSVLGDMLEGVGRVADAVPADREACALLVPLCAAFPDAFAGRMQLYARDYLRRAEAAGIPADEEIVALFRQHFGAFR